MRRDKNSQTTYKKSCSWNEKGAERKKDIASLSKNIQSQNSPASRVSDESLHKLQVEPNNTQARTNKYSSRKILPCSYSSSFLSSREKEDRCEKWADNVSQFARNEGSGMNSAHNLMILCGQHTRFRIIQHISHEQKWASRLCVYSWWRQRSLQIEKKIGKVRRLWEKLGRIMREMVQRETGSRWAW